jgi:hypothetical protein
LSDFPKVHHSSVLNARQVGGQAHAKATGFRHKGVSPAATNGPDGAIDELRFVEVWEAAD